jgi:tetratricopeptide (TPR) repeat protein
MMKRKPKKTRSIRAAEPAAKGAAPVTRVRSGRRGWWMRLGAATLVPLVLLGLLELGLRVLGYGHSTRLFLPRTIGGREFLIPNEKFTHGFFPPALARAPLSGRMAADKPEGTYRIFLLGESAAYGDPDPSFGVGRYLEALLEERYPASNFEVVCVAITAINSHVILPIARECVKHDGDLWVVYMGNNEMIGPYGAGTVFGDQAPGLGFVRAAVALKTTRLGQLMDRTIAGLRSGSAAPEAWEGIAMFSKNPLRHDDPKRLRAYENFKVNLDDILSVGEKAGVPIILSTVASNLRDCSPFLSVHSAGLKPAQQTIWQRLFEEAAALEAGGNYQAALELYEKAAALDSNFAELQFRIGSCQLALQDAGKALKSFERARDHDALAVRADTRINGIIADAVARAGAGGAVIGVDAVGALASRTPDGIPGKEFFYEHVHFTMAGNYQLARALAAKVASRLPSSITATGGERPAEAEAEACNRRLATTVWDQKRLWDVALGRISVAPFTSQSSHPRNLEYCKSRMKEVDARTTSQSPARDQAMYEAALAREPDDTLVRWNYAQFFERTGRLPDAVKQGQLICEKLPDASWPHYFVGSVMARQGRKAEAADYLQCALRITPDFPQARQELDQIRKSRR